MNIKDALSKEHGEIVKSVTGTIKWVGEPKSYNYNGKEIWSQDIKLSDETAEAYAKVSLNSSEPKFISADVGRLTTISSYLNTKHNSWVGVKVHEYENKQGVKVKNFKVSATANIDDEESKRERAVNKETDAVDNKISTMSDDEFKEWARRETQMRLDEVARDEATPPKVKGALTRGTGALTNQEAIQQAIIRQTCLKCAVEVVKCPTFNDKSQEDLVFAIKEMARELEQWVLGNDSGDKKSENNDTGEVISSEYIPF